MRSGADISATVRQGRRSARGRLVVHVRPAPDPATPSLVGFVVGKTVGAAVTRHRVTRRLRHQVRAVLSDRPEWATGWHLVVRALPSAAAATSAQLHADVVDALDRARPVSPRSPELPGHPGLLVSAP
jgi:ribonuclease P protein component